MWQRTIEHWPDLVIALVLAIIFAVVFAVIADALSIGSRVREWIRRYKNKLAGRSAARLAIRISELERRRNMLSSDRAMVLLAIQFALGALIFIALGCVLNVVREIIVMNVRASAAADVDQLFRRFVSDKEDVWAQQVFTRAWGTLSIFAFTLAGAIATAGLRLARVDREERLQKAVAQLDGEILGLKDKLTRSTHVIPPTTSSSE